MSEQSGSEPRRWMSVNEKLPELGEVVLTFRCGRMQSDFLGKNKNDPMLIWSRECVQSWRSLTRNWEGLQSDLSG